MSHKRFANNPAAAVHLVCRALAFLLDLAVLAILIYLDVAVGGVNGVKYAAVSFAVLFDVYESVIVADRNYRLHHIAPPCVVFFDVVVVILLVVGLIYDWLDAFSHWNDSEKAEQPVTSIIRHDDSVLAIDHLYLLYTMLAMRVVIIVVTVVDFFGGGHVEKLVLDEEELNCGRTKPPDQRDCRRIWSAAL